MKPRKNYKVDSKASLISKEFTHANSEFALKIFKQLNYAEPGQNIFISPFSISMLLAMVYNGTSGKTKKAMDQTLGFTNLNANQINESYLNLLYSIKNFDPKIELEVGNFIWCREDISINPEFIDKNKKYFKVESKNINFESITAADEINNKVKEVTKGRIEEIVKRGDLVNEIMFLANAIYFYGQWKDKFDKSFTEDKNFFLLDGNTKKVKMMSSSKDYYFYSANNLKVIRFPYGRDKVAMYVFLPADSSKLIDFIYKLNIDSLEKYLTLLKKVEVDVKFPKFKFEYETKELKSYLIDLGMGAAFENTAEFSGIAPEVYITDVRHKAIVEVNEEGTKAAAASGVVVAQASTTKKEFIADRPFLFLIRDDRSGTILFMGKITNPEGGDGTPSFYDNP